MPSGISGTRPAVLCNCFYHGRASTSPSVYTRFYVQTSFMPCVLILLCSCRRQLEFVYLQIVSTITSAVNKIFLSRPCFDLRSLLRGIPSPSKAQVTIALRPPYIFLLSALCSHIGSNKFMDNLILSMDTRPSFLLNAGQCLPLANSIRQVIATILQSIKTEDLVYIFLPFPSFPSLGHSYTKEVCKAGDMHIHLLLSYKIQVCNVNS